MGKPISSDDYIKIQNVLGKYNWLVDRGDGDGWAKLFVEDGVVAGLMSDPLVGHDSIRLVPINALRDFKGKMFHHLTNLYLEYGQNEDEVVGHAYNTVTEWEGGGKFFCNTRSNYQFVRLSGDWKVKRVDIEMITS